MRGICLLQSQASGRPDRRNLSDEPKPCLVPGSRSGVRKVSFFFCQALDPWVVETRQREEINTLLILRAPTCCLVAKPADPNKRELTGYAKSFSLNPDLEPRQPHTSVPNPKPMTQDRNLWELGLKMIKHIASVLVRRVLKIRLHSKAINLPYKEAPISKPLKQP